MKQLLSHVVTTVRSSQDLLQSLEMSQPNQMEVQHVLRITRGPKGVRPRKKDLKMTGKVLPLESTKICCTPLKGEPNATTPPRLGSQLLWPARDPGDWWGPGRDAWLGGGGVEARSAVESIGMYWPI